MPPLRFDDSLAALEVARGQFERAGAAAKIGEVRRTRACALGDRVMVEVSALYKAKPTPQLDAAREKLEEAIRDYHEAEDDERLDRSQRFLSKVEGDIIYRDFAAVLASRDYSAALDVEMRAIARYAQAGEHDVFGSEDSKERIRGYAIRDGDKLKVTTNVCATTQLLFLSWFSLQGGVVGGDDSLPA